MAVIWAAGWMMNRPLKLFVRILLLPVAGVLVYYCLPDFSAHDGWANGWLNVGACLPGVIAFVFLVLLFRAHGQLKHIGRVEEETTMALALTLLAGAMLVRMPLHARIYQLGFYQAALSGMVVAAFMVSEVPRWAGREGWGTNVAALGSLAVLAAGCFAIAQMSCVALSGQTVAVGSGPRSLLRGRAEIDPDGLHRRMDGSIFTDHATHHDRVRPARRRHAELPSSASESGDCHARRAANRRPDAPDTAGLRRHHLRDLAEYGITRYGATNGPGYLLLQYLRPNYSLASGHGADPLDAKTGKGVLILKRNPPSAAPTIPPKAEGAPPVNKQSFRRQIVMIKSASNCNRKPSEIMGVSKQHSL